MEYKQEQLVLSKVGSDYKYNRSSSMECENLKTKLAKIYNSKYCLVTSSGMNAISCCLNGILFGSKEKFNIIYGNELYCDTPRLFNYMVNIYNNVNLFKFDVTNGDEIENIFSNQVNEQNNILFIESCSNPNGYIFDFSLIQKLKSLSKLLYVVVDNTWLSNIIFNPLEKEADFVIISLTKYYSGGEAIAGAILSNKKEMEFIENYARIMGNHVSPFNCSIINSNIDTMRERLINSFSLTKQVLDYLKTQPKFHDLCHPLLENHKSYKYAIDYFNKINGENIGPSVLTFKVKISKNKILKIFKKCKQIEHKTSFGAKMSRTDPWPYKENDLIVCRLAIGYQDTFDNIIEGLEEIFSKIN